MVWYVCICFVQIGREELKKAYELERMKVRGKKGSRVWKLGPEGRILQMSIKISRNVNVRVSRG